MPERLGAGNLEPTQDERTMATLAHALQFIGSWIAPLISFLMNRKSRFVSFPAVQASPFEILHVKVMNRIHRRLLHADVLNHLPLCR